MPSAPSRASPSSPSRAPATWCISSSPGRSPRPSRSSCSSEAAPRQLGIHPLLYADTVTVRPGAHRGCPMNETAAQDPQTRAAAEAQTDPLARLNPAQREAAVWGQRGGGGFRAGPLLIIAGAGTGKTMTLAHRVANLVLEGVDPDCILLLTFTRRAAEEMLRRARAIVRRSLKLSEDSRAVRFAWSGTFHSVANRLLRHYAGNVGLDPAFSVLDRGDARSEEHTSELQSLRRISYAVFCLKKKKKQPQKPHTAQTNKTKKKQK